MKYTLKHNVTWNTILHVMYTLLYNEYGVQNYGLKNNKDKMKNKILDQI